MRKDLLAVSCLAGIATCALAQTDPPWDPNTPRAIAEDLATQIPVWVTQTLEDEGLNPDAPPPTSEPADPNVPIITAYFRADIRLHTDRDVCIFVYPDGRIKVVTQKLSGEITGVEWEQLPAWVEPWLAGPPEFHDFRDQPIRYHGKDDFKSKVRQRMRDIIVTRVLANILILLLALLRLLV